MQHETAKQLKDLSGWHWVGSHTTDCRGRDCEPHPTQEEAQACQHEYELANARTKTWSSAHACQECKANGTPKVWTDTAFSMGSYMGEIIFLCDEHLTLDVLRKHTSPPVSRWVS